MKLVTTKIEKNDADKPSTSNCCISSCGSEPEFEYGTRISLNGKILDKLGLDLDELTVGQEIKVAGIGKVVRLSSEEDAAGAEQSLTIQLEQIGTEPRASAATEFDSAWAEANSK